MNNNTQVFTDKCAPFKPLVHPDDWDLISQLNLEKFNAYIAGGAALKWYQGLPVRDHDIDVFFPSKENFTECWNHLKMKGTISYSSKNAISIDFNCKRKNNPYKVQLIQTNFGSAKEIIDNFDISVAQIAIDGNNWIMGDWFARDLRDHKLRFLNPTPTALKRYIKYQSYGFEPVEGTFEMLREHPSVKWAFKPEDDDYNEN
jgi:hypothetical protein